MRPHSHSRNLPALFVAVASVFVLVLLWLGWTLIGQDRELSTQRNRDRLERSAESMAEGYGQLLEGNRSTLARLLEPTSEPLSDVAEPARPERILVLVESDRFSVYPEHALKYGPSSLPPTDADPRFAELDRLEFRERNLAASTAMLLDLADDADAGVRSVALARLARVLRTEGDINGALEAYERLHDLHPGYVAGVPVRWLARYGRCRIFEETRRYDELATEATRLESTLREGDLMVDRQTYGFYVTAAYDWQRAASRDTTAVANSPPIRDPLSEAAVSVAEVFGAWQRRMEEPSGIRAIETDGQIVLAQWLGVGDRLAGLLLSQDDLGTTVKNTAVIERDPTTWLITDGAGRTVARSRDPLGPLQASHSVQHADVTWMVHVSRPNTLEMSPGERTRRMLLLLGLLSAVALVAVSTYFVTRALRREFEIARLQSEFVSAVSHEFKTPLTSIRQLTEMLRSGRIRSADRTASYYDILDREARRLNRLVESLLDFGRAEAGLLPYDMSPVSIADLVRSTVDEFRTEQHDEGPITLELDHDATVRADHSTLSLVIWNLLDNARKYSSKEAEIEIRTEVVDGLSIISVKDHGPGIVAKDQERIFDKFVRVEQDSTGSVRGTGIGLALVRRVVEDHGGKVTVNSAPGEGSTFTVSLPIVETP